MSKHESAPEDVKEKFRQALERKQAHAGRDVSAEGGHGKVESSHGRRPPAPSRCSAASPAERTRRGRPVRHAPGRPLRRARAKGDPARSGGRAQHAHPVGRRVSAT